LARPPVLAVGAAPAGDCGGGEASGLLELGGEGGRPAVVGVAAAPFPTDDGADALTGSVEGPLVPAGPALVAGGCELGGSGPGVWDELGVGLPASVGDTLGCSLLGAHSPGDGPAVELTALHVD
jgi:hypothetical protein